MKLTKAVLLVASLGAFVLSTTACDKPEPPKKEEKKADPKKDDPKP